MLIPFKKILKQAWELTKTHKFLWGLGLFLIWFQFPGNIFPAQEEEVKFDQVVERIMTWAESNPGTAGLFAVLAAVLAITITIYYFRGEAAIIIGTKAILDKQETGFKKSFKASKAFYWRVFGASVLLFAIMALLLASLASPVYYLWSNGFETRAVWLGLFAVAIYLPFCLVLGSMIGLSSIFIVLHDLRIKEALRASYDLVMKFWIQIVLLVVIMVGVSIAASIVISLVAFIIVSPFVFLSALFYNKEGFLVLSQVLSAVGLLVSAATFLFFNAILAAFNQVLLVLFFLELVRPAKIAKEEPVVAPEIA